MSRELASETMLQYKNVHLKKNLSGNIKAAKDEYELYNIMEKHYLPKRFGNEWENRTKKPLHNGYKPDYIAWKNKCTYFIEIENKEFNVQSWPQVMKYLDYLKHRYGEKSHLIVINHTFDKVRLNLLKILGVETLLISDILPEDLVARYM